MKLGKGVNEFGQVFPICSDLSLQTMTEGLWARILVGSPLKN